MMFPFMSSYQYLLNQNKLGQDDPSSLSQLGMPGNIYANVGGIDGQDVGPQSSKPASSLDTSSPWDGMTAIGTDSGMEPWKTTPSSGFHGFGPDPEARRHALGAGLVSFGTNLLEAAGHGDYAGGFARGTAGFSQAFGAVIDKSKQEAMQNVAMRRQQEADARAAQEEIDRHLKEQQDLTINSAKFGGWQQEQKDAAAASDTKSKAAADMVAQIQAIADSDPTDDKLQTMAKRAVGYSLGDASDLNKLADLHDQMTGQAYQQQDAEFKTQATIGGKKAEIAAGVVSDPTQQEKDRQRQIDIAQGHLNIAKQRADAPVTDRVKPPTPMQVYRVVENKLQNKIKQYSQATMRKPTPAQIQQWKSESAKEAEDEIKASATTARTVYRFTAGGQLLPEDDGSE